MKRAAKEEGGGGEHERQGKPGGTFTVEKK